MTVMKYAHATLVFIVSAASLPAATTLLLFALPLSSPLFIASNLIGNLTGALLQALIASLLWVRAPGGNAHTHTHTRTHTHAHARLSGLVLRRWLELSFHSCL